MSNRRKPTRPTVADTSSWHTPRADGQWPQPRPAEAYVNQGGVALHGDPESVAYVQQETHDMLCNGLGELRRSGVWWTVHTSEAAPGTTDARTALDSVLPSDDPDPRVVEVRAEILAVLEDNPAAVYVVAWCIAVVPEGQVVYG